VRNVVLTILFFMILPFSMLNAAYLRNTPTSIQQPDGTTLNLLASGDEFYNWVHDANGYTVIQDANTGWYRYAEYRNGRLTPTTATPGVDNPASFGLSPNINLPGDQIGAIRTAKAQSRMSRDGQRTPHTGALNNLVVFIRFSDQDEFSRSISYYDDMFNAASGNSMHNYYDEVSYGTLNIDTEFYPEPSGGMVVSYQDAHPRNYYCPYNATTNPIGYANDEESGNREHAMLAAACNAVASQIPASFVLDSDVDHKVDNVCFIVEGSAGAWADLLWPHQWNMYYAYCYLQGARVFGYNLQLANSLDTSGVGVLCHEMFHSLGAPDLYHYSSDGLTPVGPWDIMQYDENPPQHMSSFMKYEYGQWLSAPPEITSSGTYTLYPPSSSTNNMFRIASNTSGQYYEVEYRQKTGVFESSLPASGLLVYRIYPAVHGNADGPPDEIYAYRPGGTTTIDSDVYDANMSWQSGRTAINSGTDPNGFLLDGTDGGLVIDHVGSAGDKITFTVRLSSSVYDWDAPHNLAATVNANTVHLTWDVATGSPLGYRIYRNGILITPTTVSGTGYYDRTCPDGAVTYYMTAVFTDGESVPSNDASVAAPVMVYPYNQSFDGGFPPTGWQNTSETGSTWTRVSSGTHPTCTPHGGSYMTKFASYTFDYGLSGALITPSLNLPNSNCQVSFWMYRDSEYSTSQDKVEVYYGPTTTLSDASLLGTIFRSRTLEPAVSSNGWYQYSFPLPSGSAGEDRRIFLVGVSDYGNNIFVDDFQIDCPYPCPADLVSPDDGGMDISLTTTLNWSAPASGATVLGYHLFLGTDYPPANIINDQDLGNVTSYDPTGDFLPGTDYYWQVVPYSAAGSASDVPIWGFTTLATTPLPYSEGFEGGDTPLGWTESVFLNGAIDPSWTVVDAGAYPVAVPYAGSYMMCFNSHDASADTGARIELPEFDLSGCYAARISFQMYHDNSASAQADYLQIQAFNGSGWESIGPVIPRVISAGFTGWRLHDIDLSAYVGASAKIAIAGYSMNGANLFIDNLSVTTSTPSSDLIYISEASDNKSGQGENTAYLEIYNRAGYAIELAGLKVRQGLDTSGTGSAFTASSPEVAYTIPDGTVIPGRGFVLIGSGSNETTFTTAWGIASAIHYLPGTSALRIGTGFAYDLDFTVIRAGEVDATPNIDPGEYFQQSTPNVWESGSSEAATPAASGTGQTLPVEFSAFAATVTSDSRVNLAWSTESETEMLGYSLYRATSENLTDALPLMADYITAENASSHSDYAYTDADVVNQTAYWYWVECVSMDGRSDFHGPVTVTVTGSGQTPPPADVVTSLQGNYPNPFNPSTEIAFSIKGKPGDRVKASLCVYNLRGQLVKTLFDGYRASGANQNIVWDGRDSNGSPVGSGLYFYRLTTPEYNSIRKATLLK
jgi:M6 family metalloprotease-like protein